MQMLRAMLAQYGQESLQEQQPFDAARAPDAGRYRYADPSTGQEYAVPLEDRELYQGADRMNAIYEAMRQRRAGGGQL